MLSSKIDLAEMNKCIYDRDWASPWQVYFADRPTTEASADFLAELVPEGQALEIGIGSGRVAIPLSKRGIQVSGLGTSVHMFRYLEQNDAEHTIQT